MRDRKFPFVRVQREGHAVSGQRITCSRCGGFMDFTNKGKTHFPPEYAAKKYEAAGWVVGSTPNRDLRPDCQEGKTAMASSQQQPPAPPSLTVVPPPVMSNDDFRIIFLQLNEVYLGEKTGYAPGWSDKRIASDFNIPSAWVTEVRDKHYGPAIDPQVQLAETIRKLDSCDKLCRDELADIHRSEDKLAQLAEHFSKQAKKIEACINTIEKLRADLR